MSNRKPLTFKDYLWIVGVPVAVVALIPLIAAFGAVMQIGFVLIMPAILIGSTVHAFTSKHELSMTQVQGINVPDDLHVHPRHGWARRASSKCVVAGVDDFAQRLIGPVEAIETKAIGTHVKEGDVIAVLRRGEREIQVRAPIEGTISGTNPALASEPSVVNRSPYGRGWLVELNPAPATANASIKALLHGARAMRWMRAEIDRLVALTSPPELGMTLADGGEVGHDVSAHLDDATWSKVQSEFFS